MGTKADNTTVEGMRTAAHTLIDNFFNGLAKNEDGTPVDEVELRTDRKTRQTEGGGFLSEGVFLGVMVHYQRPRLMTMPGDTLVLQTREGKFRLVNPTGDALNALARFCIDVLGGVDEAKVLDTIGAKGSLFTDMPISDIARRSNLLFERVVEPQAPEVYVAPAEAEKVSINSIAEGIDKEALDVMAKLADEAVNEHAKDALAAEIAGLRSKAAALDLAKTHGVVLSQPAKLEEMKAVLHATLIVGGSVTAETPPEPTTEPTEPASPEAPTEPTTDET
jgi:hypothetical protein